MALKRRRRVPLRRRGPQLHLTGEAAALVHRRTSEAVAVASGDRVIERRLQTAPPAYVISHEAADLVRHAGLIEPRPNPGEVRVAVTPSRRGWKVDVAGHDQPGFLAAVTGVLAAHLLDVGQAVAATWDDGAVLDAFVVSTRWPPDVDSIQHDMARALTAPLTSIALPDAVVEFDDDASPWFTRCETRARDRPGLFHSLAVAMTCAQVDVHGAAATTSGRNTVDGFDLTDSAGTKLDEATKATIRTLVASGVRDARSVGTRAAAWTYDASGAEH